MDEFQSMDQVFIRKLTDVVLENMADEKFSVRDLVRRVGMSRPTVHRKLHSILGISASQFIREIRLECAMEMLKKDVATVSEISFMVGFHSPTYFIKCFHKFYGFSPGEVRKRYSEVLKVESGGFSKSSASNRQFSSREITKPIRNLKGTSIILSSFTLTIIVALILILDPFNFAHRNNYHYMVDSDKSMNVVVMPFQNMTNDTIWDIWQLGIQDELINSLSFSEELNLKQAELIIGLLKSKGITNYASNNLAVSISQKFDGDVVVYGSIKEAGGTLRIHAIIAKPMTGDILESFQIEGPAIYDSIFTYIDAISVHLRDYLVMSTLSEETPSFKYQSTNSPEAYKYYKKGNEFFRKDDYRTSIIWFQKALEVDSNYFSVLQRISTAYANQMEYDLARKYCLKAYKLRDKQTSFNKAMAEWNYACFFEGPDEELKYLEQLRELDDQNSPVAYLMGMAYSKMEQSEKAIPEYERAMELDHEFEIKSSSQWYRDLGNNYYIMRQYEKAKEVWERGLQVYPDNLGIIRRLASLSLYEKDTIAAKQYIGKITSIGKDQGANDASMASDLAWIYSRAGLLDTAEGYYRKALSIEPDKVSRMNAFASFLINNDRNINQGLELVKKALELSPDDYNLLHTMGWGLYKQGKYKEAAEILQKSWDLRMKNAIYNHAAFLQLEAAKEALNEQKE